MKMAMYCRRCGQKIAGTSGHAATKAVVGGLLLGPVGAIAGAAHGISAEGHGEGLCASCKLMESQLEYIKLSHESASLDIEDDDIMEEK